MGFKGAVLIFKYISFHPTFLPLKNPNFFPLTHTHTPFEVYNHGHSALASVSPTPLP